ncbi:Fructose-bisphosphate aldolase C-B, partial [Tetrabaena socialis]
GLSPLPGAADGETYTRGLEGLEAACRGYAAEGAKFAKWRATLKVSSTLPSDLAVERNADDLARYAKICQ